MFQGIAGFFRFRSPLEKYPLKYTKNGENCTVGVSKVCQNQAEGVSKNIQIFAVGVSNLYRFMIRIISVFIFTNKIIELTNTLLFIKRIKVCIDSKCCFNV